MAYLPLQGVRVLEFCQVAAGPFCGMLLGDYGADVVKIEPPQGDSLRQWPPLTGGYSENFASVNRGKKSLALDLKDTADRDLARKLVLDADVLIENNRPGVMQRLGLGWDWFKTRKPSLVYCSVSAYGQQGPRSGEGGFDLTIQAASGVMSVTGDENREPVKCGVPISDFTAGLYAAFSIASALANIRAGGQSAHIDVPMFATTLAVGALQTSEYFGTGVDPRKRGSAHPRNAPYQAFRGADGWFVIAAGNNKLWRSVCEVVGLAHLADDPRFLSPTSRAANQVVLKAILDEPFALAPCASWLEKFRTAGVPCAPINGYAQALADEQTKHLGLVHEIRIPHGGTTSTVGCPVLFNGEIVDIRKDLPVLGEHTGSARAAQGWPS